MAETVDTLLIEIKAETKKLKEGLDKVNKQLDKTKKKSAGVSKTLKKVGSVLATIGGVAILNQVVNTVRTFEDLEATLRAVTGSAEAASKSFELIRAFTATTTFQIEEVAQAFITLKQAGIVPTSDALQDFGNFAAGMGKSITQLAQAAFNATTGEMEMLKQFGVIARQQGDKITVTFDGVTKEIERSGASIVDFLRSIGREKFPTAIAERANTLSGAISNLQDQVSEFNVSVGEGGLSDALVSLSRNTGALLQNLRPLGDFIGFTIGLFVSLVDIVVQTIDAIVLFVKVISDPIKAATAFNEAIEDGAFSFEKFRNSMVGTMSEMEKLDKELDLLIGGVNDVTQLLNTSQKATFGFFEQLRIQAAKSGKTISSLAEEDFGKLEATLRRMETLEIAKSLFSLPKEMRDAVPELKDKSFTDIVEGLSTPLGRSFLGKTEEYRTVVIRIMDAVRDQMLMGFENIPSLIEFLQTKPFENLLNEQETGFLSFSRSLIDETELLKNAFNEMNDEGLMNMFNTIKQFLPEALQDFQTWKETVSDAFNDASKSSFDFSKSLEDALTEASLEISSNFVEALRTGEDALQSFKDLALRIVDQIIAAFIQMQVIDPILAGIFKTGGGGDTGDSTGLPEAGGGAMHVGQARLVGERGPELFIPHANGTLLNNMNTKNALGGGQTVVVNQSVNFATGVQATVRNEVLQLMPQIAEVTKSAVSGSAERSVRFRGALQGA